MKKKEQLAAASGKDDVIWRFFSFVMSGLFTVAAVSQTAKSLPCIWVPVFSVPAGLCLLVALKLRYSGFLAWRMCYAVHSACCMALLVLVMVRVVRLLHRPAPAPIAQNIRLMDHLRDLAALTITIVWMKMTKHVSDSHVSLSVGQREATWVITATILLTMGGTCALFLLCLFRSPENKLVELI